MEGFSRLELLVQAERERLRRAAELLPGTPWPESEKSPERVRARYARACQDYWYFDQQYFPPSAYQNYARPGEFQRYLVRTASGAGIHVEHGPRGSAKTVTLKKFMAWLYYRGTLQVGMTYGSTIEKAGPLQESIGLILSENPRIVHDLRPRIIEQDDEHFSFTSPLLGHRAYLSTFSLRRSARGMSRGFHRPTFALGDDLQNENSPLGSESNAAVLRHIGEVYKSMADSQRMLMIVGNNFSPECFIEDLRIRQEHGLLAPHWNVHITPAWDPATGSYWPERYPATSEEEMRAMVEADDDEDWYGNFQGAPIEPTGKIFPVSGYVEMEDDSMPEDAQGVGWCDPNLSLKGAGDTTAVGSLLWTPRHDLYLVQDPHCESFADPNRLLALYLQVLQRPNVLFGGMDGHVSQASTWTAFIRGFCFKEGIPFPVVHFRRYLTDHLAKNVQIPWSQGRVRFPHGFANTPVGKLFRRQILTFAGKKKNRKDDAADWLISSFELLHELHLARPGNPDPPEPPVGVDDYYAL